MKDRRMLCKDIIESDEFLDMPSDCQMLYIHLNMYADDRGIVAAPKKVLRLCGASEDSMNILVAKKFLLKFSSDNSYMVVIKHWCMHNTIRKDRFKESCYVELLNSVYIDENGSYSMNPEGHVPFLTSGCQPNRNQVTTNCQPDDNQTATSCQPSDNQVVAKTDEFDNQNSEFGNQVTTKPQPKLSKVNLSKVNISKINIGEINKERVPEETTQPASAEPDQEPSGVIDTHKHIDYEGLIKVALRLGNHDRANHYYKMALNDGVQIDVEKLKSEAKAGG